MNFDILHVFICGIDNESRRSACRLLRKKSDGPVPAHPVILLTLHIHKQPILIDEKGSADSIESFSIVKFTIHYH